MSKIDEACPTIAIVMDISSQIDNLDTVFSGCLYDASVYDDDLGILAIDTAVFHASDALANIPALLDAMSTDVVSIMEYPVDILKTTVDWIADPIHEFVSANTIHDEFYHRLHDYYGENRPGDYMKLVSTYHGHTSRFIAALLVSLTRTLAAISPTSVMTDALFNDISVEIVDKNLICRVPTLHLPNRVSLEVVWRAP